MVSKAARREIWERDRGVCGICGTPVAVESMHLDHITPESLGGSSDPTNLRPAHPRCNIGRGNGRVPRTVPNKRHGTPWFVRRFPVDLAEAIQKEADRGRRSFSAQVFWMLEAALKRGLTQPSASED